MNYTNSYNYDFDNNESILDKRAVFFILTFAWCVLPFLCACCCCNEKIQRRRDHRDHIIQQRDVELRPIEIRSIYPLKTAGL